MTIPVIAFFNNKGGVGKTSLVYHLAEIIAHRGLSVLAADLDPQGNLTAAFVDEDRLATIFESQNQAETVFDALKPLIKGTGDITLPRLEVINPKLALLVGDMGLSSFEDQLSESWPKCLNRDERAFRVTSAFWRIVQAAAKAHNAEVALVDLGPNLGAINRAALIASDYVVIPLGPDLFSLLGLKNLGPALRQWRHDWRERLEKRPDDMEFALPSGNIEPVGYVVLRHSIRLDRPVIAFERWMARIPETYKKHVLDEPGPAAVTLDADTNCIAKLKDYRSLMPLAHEARKPMFFLKSADGALGAHMTAARQAYDDFLKVAQKIASRTGLPEI